MLGTTTTTLRYDPEHYRIDRMDTVGGVSTSMAYIGDPASGGFAEFFNDGGLHWHDYLLLDGHYVAEHFCDGFPTCTSAGTWKYFVTDNLGSVAAITDASGTVVERDSYDPWGRPRVYASGADDSACGSTPTPVSKRGYTGHERIDSECLVNANARIYDPTIGRFMSPDSMVSDPADLQDWNSYSYVDNRPLTLTDPTGHAGDDDPMIDVFHGDKIWGTCCGISDNTSTVTTSGVVTVQETVDDKGTESSVGVLAKDGSVVPETKNLGADIINNDRYGTPSALAAKSGGPAGSLTAQDFAAARDGFDATFHDAIELAQIEGLPAAAVARIHPSPEFAFKKGSDQFVTTDPVQAETYSKQGYFLILGDTGKFPGYADEQSLIFWTAALGGIQDWAGKNFNLTPTQSTELTIFHEWSHIDPGYSSYQYGEYQADQYALQHVSGLTRYWGTPN